MLRDRAQAFNSSPHRKEACPVNIYRVDFFDFDKGDTPGRRFLLDSSARASREDESSLFESSIPVMRVPVFRITAAAETSSRLASSGLRISLMVSNDFTRW
jgi:hypothetical protein